MRRRTAGYSLRRRLIAMTLGSSVTCWLVGLAIIVGVAWTETRETFDDALEEGARLLAAFDLAGGDGEVDARDRFADRSVRLYYQVVDARGQVLHRAADVPARAFVVPAELGQDDEDDDELTRTVWAGNALWRVHVRRARGGRVVEVAQPLEQRTELLGEMAENLLWPALLLLALLTAVNGWVIRRQLRPLERLADAIGAKSPRDLSAVPLTGQVIELRPIVLALNAVLSRLDTALESERRFTADAAHELRTPLAALRMKLQLLQRTQAQSPGAAQALAALRGDVDRCTSLLENLLMLARLDPHAPGGLECTTVALPALIEAVLADAAAAIQAHTAQVRLALPVDTVWAHPPLLHAALRNLLDNALRYGGQGVNVQIDAEPHATGVRLWVRDDGPGVSPADRKRLTQRFFRVLGHDAPGSGLGLSIVARIVRLHDGRLDFAAGPQGRGLAVSIELPGRPAG